MVVVGGGNVAMDCVRSARRMGARSVHLVYRRTVEDMPAEHDEIHAAEEEGHLPLPPIRRRWLSRMASCTGVELVQMRQTELDAKAGAASSRFPVVNRS